MGADSTATGVELPRRSFWDRFKTAGGTWIARALARFVMLTCRFELVEGSGAPPSGPCQLTFWHDQSLLTAIFFRWSLVPSGFPLAVLVSRSADGDLPARVATAWGGHVARGSASRGGRGGLRELYRIVQERGASPMVAPDGPKGPRRVCKPGGIALAQLAGIPVLPVALHAEHAWYLGSWDRLAIPWPFSHIRVMWGNLVQPSAERGNDDTGGDTARRVQVELDRINEAVERTT